MAFCSFFFAFSVFAIYLRGMSDRDLFTGHGSEKDFCFCKADLKLLWDCYMFYRRALFPDDRFGKVFVALGGIT